MSRFAIARRSRRVGFSLLVIGAFILGTTLGPGVAAAANTAVSNVFVTNTSSNPVPVSVTNLPATQPVSGSVSVSNQPTHITVDNTSAAAVPVAPQGTTQLVGSGPIAQNGVGIQHLGSTFDVSAYGTVRVTVNTNGSCTTEDVIVYDSAGNVLLDGIPDSGCRGSWVLPVPSTTIKVDLLNRLDSDNLTGTYSIYGRP